MSDYLPDEVIEHILSRVPVKSLLRFRCVCKSWLSLIGSPRFIAATANNGQKLLLLRYISPATGIDDYSLRFDDGTYDEYASFRCPFKATYDEYGLYLCPTESGKIYDFRVVGICNGLICLTDIATIILWNPAIRKFVNLPRPSIDLPTRALGFGFDYRNNDFKVVRLATASKGGERGIATPPMIEVYSLKSGSWRSIVNGWNHSYGVVWNYWTQVFINGSVHWVGYKSADHRNRFPLEIASPGGPNGADNFFRVAGYKSCPEDGFHNVILSFDLADEVFRMFEIPDYLAGRFPLNFSLGQCGGSLALFAYDIRINSNFVDVWVMKEYGVVESWTSLCRVKSQGSIWTVFGFTTDGDEMLLAAQSDEIFTLSPSGGLPTNLGIRGVKNSLYAGPYVESTALLDGLNGGLNAQVKSCEPVAEEEKEVNEEFRQFCLHTKYAEIAGSLIGLAVGLP